MIIGRVGFYENISVSASHSEINNKFQWMNTNGLGMFLLSNTQLTVVHSIIFRTPSVLYIFKDTTIVFVLIR